MNLNNPVKGKVLIADDDDDGRAMLAFLLDMEGWQVAQARNGREALEKVLVDKPHVLVLDNRMPELTGAEVCQRLREQGIGVPVVFVTAYSDGQELADSLGLRYFLKKPYDFPDLFAALDSAYRDSQTQN
ncbi:response regulator transcription factor [Kamptonema formosum]|uniref:response regulator transcription factor n=1 Tax=Kamptonema formosum TaxID=331992 RepID=UPI00034B3D1C|nr:response regulator [Oscillatoria sp. PCC 10802]